MHPASQISQSVGHACSRFLFQMPHVVVADNSDENRAFHVAAVLSLCTKSFALSPQTPPAHGGGKRCPDDDSQPSGRMGVIIASDPAQDKWCKASCKRRACATVLLGAESAPLLHFLPLHYRGTLVQRISAKGTVIFTWKAL